MSGPRTGRNIAGSADIAIVLSHARPVLVRSQH